ncbi:MAG: hypothetical protein ACR2N4_05015 [Jatrophihabitans sp.]
MTGTLGESQSPPVTEAPTGRRPPLFLRSWVIVLVGLLISGATANYFAHRPGVYWSQVQVLFVAPKSAANPNGLSVSSESLITTAGVVAKMVGSSPPGPSVVSDTVTLVGEGIRHGYGVRLPNSGGQFATNFDQAALDVQAAGTTVVEVSATLSKVLDQITTELSTLQSDAHVAPVNLIRAELSPPTPPIYYQTGSKSRALAITLVIGGGITAFLAWFVRRRFHGPVPALG